MALKTGCIYCLLHTVVVDKEALDLVGEKMSGQLLPGPALLNKLLDDN